MNKTGVCVFVDRPGECWGCLESQILQCLVNKRHLKLTDDGKIRVVASAVKEAFNPDRYKTKSGKTQRPPWKG
jgi:hypothetical protein